MFENIGKREIILKQEVNVRDNRDRTVSGGEMEAQVNATGVKSIFIAVIVIFLIFFWWG